MEKTNTGGTEPNEPATPTALSKAVEETGTVPPGKAGQARRRLRLGAGWRFTRHLLEMVVAMMTGMAVLGVALAVLGEPPGYANLFVRYGLMGAFMAAPMVGWMRFRGHSMSDGLEMTTAMLLPMFAPVVAVELGVARYVPGLSEQSLPLLSHVGMIAGMVAMMLYRRDRYVHGARGHRA
jgi:flagellar biosynthetic protein FliP